MRFPSKNSAVFALLALSGVDALPTRNLRGRSWQDFFNRERPAQNDHKVNAQRADAVVEAYLHSWAGYSKYAFGHDELHPVSNTPGDSRNGWGASIADAITTGILMGLKDPVQQQLDHLTTVDFTQTDDGVSLFETTIRYLGGLVSGYDLLKGPFQHLVSDSSKVDALLSQAKTLADVLSGAFDTPSKLPDNNLNFVNGQGKPSGSGNTGLAVAGTLVLEWTRLSDLLGDDKYATLTQNGEKYLLNPQPASREPWPGLVGTSISLDDGTFEDSNGGWGGSDDSFYEYLIKMYAYSPSRFPEYRDRWVLAAQSTIDHLSSPSGGHTFVAGFRGKTQVKSEGHLTCFIGGNFLLGGAVLKNKKFTDFGLAMVESCHATYAATATHVGPESFGWDSNSVPSNQRDFFKKNGFYIQDSSYNLRPEVVESYYYAYMMTGDSKYQDWAWDAFVGINGTCRTASGFTSVNNVNVVGGGGTRDMQESFWFAEVLKYFYLIFSNGGMKNGVGVSGGDKQMWVFNTEAHPFSVAV